MSKTAATLSTERGKESAWAPLKEKVFRELWAASVVSNIGTWVHDVGAGWLMTALSSSPLLIALVQTASSLPIFVMAILAGALADLVDRRRLLMIVQVWMFSVATILGFLTLTGTITPRWLLLLTFAIGAGTAMHIPTWQATTPQLVPPSQLNAAMALGGIGINLARTVGPALGGFLIAAAGLYAPFFFNALTFLGVFTVLLLWRRQPEAAAVMPAERLMGAIRNAMRYPLHAGPLKIVLIRTFAFMACGSAIWALIPLLARRTLGLNSAQYGILLGSFGIGAIVGATVLPGARKLLSIDLLMNAGSILFAAVLATLALLTNFSVLCLVMFIAGLAWICIMSSLNISAQKAVPSWIKARALAIYLLAFQGGIAIGSTIWGTIGSRISLTAALILSAASMVASTAVLLRYKLSSIEGLDVTPSMHWPVPVMMTDIDDDQGPVFVTVEYRIFQERKDAFIEAVRLLGQIRKRDGATCWGLFLDAAAPDRFVETFLVESWTEHLNQHKRMLKADLEFEEKVRSPLILKEPPIVRHLISAGKK